ncbi:tail fiber assembly protein [Cupriavidus sp. KB_39]|uniref:tail fiber assembly protein n=1 Tax=Cupriavidus sp. KB_39 TaxID=3233036 RepID=UPI003F8EB38A
MLIHSYDNLTGQYIASCLADADPLRDGQWLQPSFTTALPLPERTANTWPFFLNDSWVLKPDYRGKILHRCDNGQAAEILFAGVTLEEAGLTVQPRPSNDHRWDNGEWTLDPEAVTRTLRQAAMSEFDQRMDLARQMNHGMADAFAAGLLDEQQAALFRAWATYQMDLVRVVNSSDFPARAEWPPEPNETEIVAIVEQERRMQAQQRLAQQQAEAGAAQAERERAQAMATVPSDSPLTQEGAA